jgi:hypothetical protein
MRKIKMSSPPPLPTDRWFISNDLTLNTITQVDDLVIDGNVTYVLEEDIAYANFSNAAKMINTIYNHPYSYNNTINFLFRATNTINYPMTIWASASGQLTIFWDSNREELLVSEYGNPANAVSIAFKKIDAQNLNMITIVNKEYVPPEGVFFSGGIRRNISIYLNGKHIVTQLLKVEISDSQTGFEFGGTNANMYLGKFEIWKNIVLTDEQIETLFVNIGSINQVSGEWTSQLLINKNAAMPGDIKGEWGYLFFDVTDESMLDNIIVNILNEDGSVVLQDLYPQKTIRQFGGSSVMYDISTSSIAQSNIKINILMNSSFNSLYPKIKNIRVTYKNYTQVQTITKKGREQIVDSAALGAQNYSQVKSILIGINQETVNEETQELVSPINIVPFVYEVIEGNEVPGKIKIRFKTRTDKYQIYPGTTINALALHNVDPVPVLFGVSNFVPFYFDYESIPRTIYFDITFSITSGNNKYSFLTDHGKKQIIERLFENVKDAYTEINTFTLGDYQSEVGFPQTNIVSYWKFDEVSGTYFSDHYNFNNGTGNNERITGGSGKIGKGADFTKGPDEILLGNVSLQTKHNWTMGFWFKRNNLSNSNQAIYSENIGTPADGWGDSINDGLILYISRGEPKFTLVIDKAYDPIGGPSMLISSNSYVPDSNWHHLVVVKNGTNVKFYLDNVDIGGGTLFQSLGGNIPTKAQFGHRKWWHYEFTDHYDGLLDEAFVFSRAITTNEINIIYNLGMGLQVDDTIYQPTSPNELDATKYGPSLITSIKVDRMEPDVTARVYLPDISGNGETYNALGIWATDKIVAIGKLNKQILKTTDYYYIFTLRYKPLITTNNIG